MEIKSILSFLVAFFTWIMSLCQVENKIQLRGSIFPKIECISDTLDIIEQFMMSDYLKQIIHRESRGDSTVISTANCMGLYQIHPMYFRQVGIQPMDYVVNGRFTGNVAMQNKVCKHFISEQIKYLKVTNYPITLYNLYRSWEGIGHFKR